MAKKISEVVEKETKALVTTLVGSFRCSVPYYLSRVLCDLNLKTLVIDNTTNNETFKILRKAEFDTVLKRKNTYFVKDRLISKEVLETLDKSFDNVIVLVGNEESAFNKDLFDRTDHFIFITGYDRFSREEFRQACTRLYSISKDYLSDKDRLITMVWNDKTPCKIIEKDFESRCNLSVTNRFYIRSCDANKRNYISLTESGEGKVKSLSEDYKDFLIKTVEQMTDGTRTRMIKKLCK